MKYKKFIIQGYRGISDRTELDISKDSIIPIIGKNESGKTTFLEAVNAFDFTNDKNNSGKHITNVENRYSTIEANVFVEAEIIVDNEFDFKTHFQPYFDEVKKEFLTEFPKGEFDIMSLNEDDKYKGIEFVHAYKLLKNRVDEEKTLIIRRDLKSKRYSFPLLDASVSSEFENLLAENFVEALPYTLYFDDFRDRIPEQLYLLSDEENPMYSSWIQNINELFKQTNSQYSVFTISEKHDTVRRSIIGEVKDNLNMILSEEWSKYQFENSESIQLDIIYSDLGQGPFLEFKLVEIIQVNGRSKERFFDLSDRSKGFYWYFNFMLKLHFNPTKRDNGDVDTIYLLDEPGSYLHTYALDKLAEQLKRISSSNKVIYCTHSHNLLNPNFIPINSIRLAEKINQGKIIIKRIDEITSPIRKGRNSAFQPVLDALEVKPLVEYEFDKVILLEGIYDFYSFKMFCSSTLSYFPCVSASSIVNQIPYMIFLGKKYLALWDNDGEGRNRLIKAREHFGETEGEKFLALSSLSNGDNTRLEDYYDKSEIDQFNFEHLQLKDNSLYRTILNLFFSQNRHGVIEQYFSRTKTNFQTMEKVLIERIDSQVPAQLIS